jgi:hypothetical protein
MVKEPVLRDAYVSQETMLLSVYPLNVSQVITLPSVCPLMLLRRSPNCLVYPLNVSHKITWLFIPLCF